MTRTPEQEIEHLRAALAVQKAECRRLTSENMDLAALIHHAGLDGEPMQPLAPPLQKPFEYFKEADPPTYSLSDPGRG